MVFLLKRGYSMFFGMGGAGGSVATGSPSHAGPRISIINPSALAAVLRPFVQYLRCLPWIRHQLKSDTISGFLD